MHNIVFVGLIISLLAIYQYFFGFKHTLVYMNKAGINNLFALEHLERKRAFFPFITPNVLAAYLIMALPLALSDRKNIWIFIPLFFALLLTKSLVGILSIFLALFVYFRMQLKIRKKWPLVLSAFGTLIILSIIFATRISIEQRQQFDPVFSIGMRMNYWKEALNIIKMHPIAGVGLGNFNLTHSRYAHNLFLQLWAEMGILGLISMLWLIFLSFGRGIRNFKTNMEQNHIIAAALSASLAFLFSNLFDIGFFIPEVAFIWWVILGLGQD